MKRPAAPKKLWFENREVWFELELMGVTWKVFLVDTKYFQEWIANREGVCIFQQAEILIDKNLPDFRKPDVAIHEILHAINYIQGVEKAIKLSGPEDPEEALVSMQAPLLYAGLCSRQYLKLPPIPAGW